MKLTKALEKRFNEKFPKYEMLVRDLADLKAGTWISKNAIKQHLSDELERIRIKESKRLRFLVQRALSRQRKEIRKALKPFDIGYKTKYMEKARLKEALSRQKKEIKKEAVKIVKEAPTFYMAEKEIKKI